MPKRNLLLCFDAFGTLFRLRQPVEVQYGSVARDRPFGLDGFTDEQLRASFRAAFAAEARRHPNYGRSRGLGATRWWTNVIDGTFGPLLAATTPPGTVPPGLASCLIERFASKAAYVAAAPDLPGLLRALRRDQTRYACVVVGVITNSDDRVPDILASLDLRVRPLRWGGGPSDGSADTVRSMRPGAAPYDIDFHCMSYDVGVEKPDPRIFDAAETLLPAVLAQADIPTDTPADGADGADSLPWDRVYVGDEVAKDVEGARAAGWHPVLLLDETARRQLQKRSIDDPDPDHDDLLHLPRLEDCPPQPLRQLFGEHVVVSVDSITALVDWLVRGTE